jgi:hypothetical protein
VYKIETRLGKGQPLTIAKDSCKNYHHSSLWGRLFAVYKIYSQDLVSQECQVGNFIPRNKYEIVFG